MASSSFTKTLTLATVKPDILRLVGTEPEASLLHVDETFPPKDSSTLAPPPARGNEDWTPCLRQIHASAQMYALIPASPDRSTAASFSAKSITAEGLHEYARCIEEAILQSSQLNCDEAQSMMDNIQAAGDSIYTFHQLTSLQILVGPEIYSLLSQDGLRLKYRKLQLKLAEAKDVIPTSVVLKGITGMNEHPVGGGAFADVYVAEYARQKVALKRVRTHTMMRRDAQDFKKKLFRESFIWQQLSHPNILPFLGVETLDRDASYCMVSPWLDRGNILQYLRQNTDRKRLNELLSQIAQGVAYLHEQFVVHGDLRGNNILVDAEGNAQIADFGLSVFANATIRHKPGYTAGSLRWMAPELIHPTLFGLGQFERTFSSDVYSLACVCIELYTLLPPFSLLNQDMSVVLNVIRNIRPPRPDTMSSDLWDLVKRCWSHVIQERPSAKTVVSEMEAIIDSHL